MGGWSAGGQPLTLSCKEAWAEIKLEATCEGFGVARTDGRSGAAPPPHQDAAGSNTEVPTQWLL